MYLYNMIIRKNKILNLLVLLIASLDISLEDSSWFYERNKNVYCPSKYEFCDCEITFNNPYTPIIPGKFLNQAILSYYRYIYLIFIFPSEEIQKTFYLEATDITKGKTVISNGDCYPIDLNKNVQYELRIYQPVYDTEISIKFLGLNPGFKIQLSIKFLRDLNIYYNGIMLTNTNSLYQSQVLELIENNDRLKPLEIRQKERKERALQTANKILMNLFGKTLDTDAIFKENIFTQTFFIPPVLLVTLSTAVGLEETTESLFKPNDDEEKISEHISVYGGVTLDSNMFDDILGDNWIVTNFFMELLKLYNQKVNDLVFYLGLQTEVFTLTISKSLTKPCIILTLRFFDQVTHKNFYEIEIKVELTNQMILDMVLETQTILANAFYEAIEFKINYGDEILLKFNGIVLVIVIFAIIITAILAAKGGTIIAIGGAVTSTLVLIINTLPFEIPFQQYIPNNQNNIA